jgi:hypothetical protein
MLASEEGKLRFVELLLLHGANPNAEDPVSCFSQRSRGISCRKRWSPEQGSCELLFQTLFSASVCCHPIGVKLGRLL